MSVVAHVFPFLQQLSCMFPSAGNTNGCSIIEYWYVSPDRPPAVRSTADELDSVTSPRGSHGREDCTGQCATELQVITSLKGACD